MADLVKFLPGKNVPVYRTALLFAGCKFHEFHNFESNSRKIRLQNLAFCKIRGVASGTRVDAQWRY